MTTNTNSSNNKPSIIIIGLVVLAAIVLLPRLLNNTPTTTAPNVPVEQNPQTSDTGTIQLGSPVSASSVDSRGCASESQSNFSPSDSIYVVAPDSNVTQGTRIFVRLYQGGNVVEDAPEITADRNYTANCINFVFQPTGADFAAGNYEAQFFVNGNPGPSVQFDIQ